MSKDAEKQHKNKAEPPAQYRWKPGQSGNPKGRPKKGSAIAELLRGRPTKLAVDRCLQILEADGAKRMEWLAAAEFVAKWGHGRPEVLESAQDGPKVVIVAVDRAPKETREQWLERQRGRLETIEIDPEVQEVEGVNGASKRINGTN